MSEAESVGAREPIRILEQAVDMAAEQVVLEWAHGDLEVSYVKGHIGPGHLLSDRE